MKANFIFDLDKPEDAELYEIMKDAYNTKCGIDGFSNKLRSIVKYNSTENEVIKELLETHPEITNKLVYEIKDMFHETLREYREDD